MKSNYRKHLLLLIIISGLAFISKAQDTINSPNVNAADTSTSLKNDSTITAKANQNDSSLVDSSKIVYTTYGHEDSLTKDSGVNNAAANSDVQEPIDRNSISNNSEKSISRGTIYFIILILFIALRIYTRNKWNWKPFDNAIKGFARICWAILLFLIAQMLKNKNGNQDSSGQQKLYWWQCKRCGAYSLPIKKSTKPSNLNCPSGDQLGHFWTKLAEVGDTNYQCLRCNVQIQAKSRPTTVNCPSGDQSGHKWTKL